MSASRLLLAFLLVCWITSCKNLTEQSEILAIEGIVTLHDTNQLGTDWSRSTTFVAQMPTEPDNLHPTNGSSAQRSELFVYLHRFLVTNSHGNGIEPDLLETLPLVDADNKTYHYRLKKGITWDDGEPMTAADVLFTCKVNLASLTNNPAFHAYWSKLEAFIPDPKDPLAFSIIMKEPHVQNVSFFSGFPVLQKTHFDPSDLLAKYSITDLNQPKASKELEDWFRAFNQDAIGRDPKLISGLGEYAVQDWKPGVSILLKRKNQINGAPAQILFRFAKDENTIALDLKNQVYDAAGNLSMTAFLQLAADHQFTKNYHCALSPTFNYSYLCFNSKPDSNRSPLFVDARVRTAIAHLIPVDQIISMIYQSFRGQAKRMASNVSPYKKECDSTLKPLDCNRDEAVKLLAVAGWQDHNHDGTIDHGDINMNAELLYLNTSPDWSDMAAIIVQEMAKVGITVKAVAVDQSVFLDKARNHQFDMLLGSFGGSSSAEDYSQLWSTTSWLNHGSNYSGFGNTRTDSLIQKINTELNEQLRFKLSHQLQQEIYREQPMIFLYSSLRRTIVHKRWGNIRLFPDRPGMDISSFRLISGQ